MRDLILKGLCNLSIIACIFSTGFIFSMHELDDKEEIMVTYAVPNVAKEAEIKAEPTVIFEPEEPMVPDEDIDLIALVTMAEAEDEPEEGKRLVIDTILNRTDHSRFPNTVSEVIYQSGAFSSMWNGRVDRCYVTDDIRKLVIEELESRTDSNVIFFRTDYYSEYGEPLYQVGNHYFSSY